MIINYTMHYAYYKHVFRTCGQPILRQCQWKIFVQQSKYNRCTQFSGIHVRECVLVKAVYYIQIQQTITTLLIDIKDKRGGHSHSRQSQGITTINNYCCTYQYKRTANVTVFLSQCAVSVNVLYTERTYLCWSSIKLH